VGLPGGDICLFNLDISRGPESKLNPLDSAECARWGKKPPSDLKLLLSLVNSKVVISECDFHLYYLKLKFP
jgi:hypothetical protein